MSSDALGGHKKYEELTSLEHYLLDTEQLFEEIIGDSQPGDTSEMKQIFSEEPSNMRYHPGHSTTRFNADGTNIDIQDVIEHKDNIEILGTGTIFDAVYGTGNSQTRAVQALRRIMMDFSYLCWYVQLYL